LVDMSIKDIVSALPQVCKDPTEIFTLFLEYYPENQLMPVMSKLFQSRLSLDIETMERKIQEFKDLSLRGL